MVGFWQPGPLNSPVFATLRLLPRASARLTGAVGTLVIFTALLPSALALAAGALVGSIGGAAAHGWGSADGRRLIASVVILIILFVADHLAGPALRLLADCLGRRVEGHMRARVMAAALEPAGVVHLADPGVVDLVSDAQRVGTGQSTVKDATVGMAVVTSNTLAAVLAAAVLARYRWWLAIGLLTAYVGMTWVLVGQLRRTVGALRGNARRFRRSAYFRDIALLPGAARELRIFGLGQWTGDRFAKEWDVAMEGFWRERPHGRWGPPTSAVVIGGALAVTYTALGRSAVRGEISLGQLAMFAGAATGVAAVYRIGWDNINITYGTAAVPAAIELEHLLTESRFQLDGASPAAGPIASGVRFEGVSFQYPGSSQPVFAGLDLEIAAGQSLAIVGPNGAGKTTLVKLLARLYDPSVGRIMVDGVDLASVDARQWQRNIAAIFQDFVHYELSATDNIGFGAIERAGDPQAVTAAARRAGADEIIAGLPHGWETVLSRRTKGGVELSGGQWQRVALARAMFAVDAGASVLILDEPTAALDVRAEAAFYDQFLELTSGITTIVISHRFSTVRRAERIVVIEGGIVREDGNHETLLAANGRYAEMFRLQAARLEPDVEEPAGA